MKLFVDTAEVSEIKEAVSWGVVSGVTTNPTLIMKSGRKFEDVVKEIAGLVDGPVSAEVAADDAEGMVSEAVAFSKWHKNVIIKFPMTEEGLKAVAVCSKKGIRSNVTLVFSPAQALLAARAGATFVSPFIGRLDDAGQDGVAVVRDIVAVFRAHGISTQVIAASVRKPEHVVESAKAGAEIATVPFKVLKEMFKHPLTDAGLKKFAEDWAKARK